MKPPLARPTRTSDLSWLLDVTESRQPVSEHSSIWVRQGVVHEGPPTPHPERLPYCEFGIVLQGKGTSLVEGEEPWPLPGDLLLLGPGAPPWGRIRTFSLIPLLPPRANDSIA